MDRHERFHPDGTEGPQRLRAGPGGVRVAEGVVALAQELPHARRRSSTREDARELRQVREPVGDPPGKGHVHAEAALGDGLEVAARVLFLVGEDQIGLEGADVVDPRVLGPADAREPRDHVPGQLAVVGPSDERPGAAESGDAQRVARDQRHDAPRRRGEVEGALAIVEDADGAHGRLSPPRLL